MRRKNSGIGDGTEDFLKVGFLGSGCLTRAEGLAWREMFGFVFSIVWMMEGSCDEDGMGGWGRGVMIGGGLSVTLALIQYGSFGIG